jgi:hypothetical protein
MKKVRSSKDRFTTKKTFNGNTTLLKLLLPISLLPKETKLYGYKLSKYDAPDKKKKLYEKYYESYDEKLLKYQIDKISSLIKKYMVTCEENCKTTCKSDETCESQFESMMITKSKYEYANTCKNALFNNVLNKNCNTLVALVSEKSALDIMYIKATHNGDSLDDLKFFLQSAKKNRKSNCKNTQCIEENDNLDKQKSILTKLSKIKNNI